MYALTTTSHHLNVKLFYFVSFCFSYCVIIFLHVRRYFVCSSVELFCKNIVFVFKRYRS